MGKGIAYIGAFQCVIIYCIYDYYIYNNCKSNEIISFSRKYLKKKIIKLKVFIMIKVLIMLK